jgi:hypothetical protein
LVFTNGLFKIINVNSGKAIEVASGSTANGAKVQQNDYTGAARQQWRIQPVGGGQYVNGTDFESVSKQTGIRTTTGGMEALSLSFKHSGQAWESNCSTWNVNC